MCHYTYLIFLQQFFNKKMLTKNHYYFVSKKVRFSKRWYGICVKFCTLIQ